MSFDDRLLAGGMIIVALVAWGALGYLIFTTPPDPPYRIAFLALLLVASAASVAPMTLYLNRRFAAFQRGRDQVGALRQSLWIGGFVMLCAWMRMGRGLSWAAALVFLGLFILLELLFAGRERGP
ncbi:MAG: hypothetical protein U9Q78_03275 [Chloroflexota bacterium]|nr:hypothetical protein [Chloroflexota bacterium]